METQYIAISLVFVAVMAVGSVSTAYQLYHIVKSDAKARALKHPKFWGLLAINGNNASGLLPYLIARRNYPVIHASKEYQTELEQRKKRILVSLLFTAAGAIGMACLIFLYS